MYHVTRYLPQFLNVVFIPSAELRQWKFTTVPWTENSDRISKKNSHRQLKLLSDQSELRALHTPCLRVLDMEPNINFLFVKTE